MHLNSLGARMIDTFIVSSFWHSGLINPQIYSEQLKANLLQKIICFPSWLRGWFNTGMWDHQFLTSFCFQTQHLCLFNSLWLSHTESHGSHVEGPGATWLIFGSDTVSVYVAHQGRIFISLKLSSRIESIYHFPGKVHTISQWHEVLSKLVNILFS